MVKTLNFMHNKNKFKLGIFGVNASSGMAFTKVKERWVNSWENNLKIARLADEAGFEYMLSVGRWLGYAGETNFNSNVLEPITWTSALLASTQKINIITTVHTSLHNPVILAKQLATMDHIGGGRVGLNMVCGFNRSEYEALGSKLLSHHEDRYQHAQEWLDIIRKLWREDKAFDWDSQYFKLKKTYSLPLPLQENIPIFNGAGSGIGREFAIRNVDYLFMMILSLNQLKKEISILKSQEKQKKRKIPLNYTSFSPVVCRPTRKEAEEYLYYYSQENADWPAVDYLIKFLLGDSKVLSPEAIKAYRSQWSAGHGGYPLVGTPDDIADSMEALYNVGLSGLALTFVDYIGEFPYFRDEVLPRLEKRGLREPFNFQ